jgi:hypothetical protein
MGDCENLSEPKIRGLLLLNQRAVVLAVLKVVRPVGRSTLTSAALRRVRRARKKEPHD